VVHASFARPTHSPRNVAESVALQVAIAAKVEPENLVTLDDHNKTRFHNRWKLTCSMGAKCVVSLLKDVEVKPQMS
jgi:ribosomal protein L4